MNHARLVSLPWIEFRGHFRFPNTTHVLLQQHRAVVAFLSSPKDTVLPQCIGQDQTLLLDPSTDDHLLVQCLSLPPRDFFLSDAEESWERIYRMDLLSHQARRNRLVATQIDERTLYTSNPPIEDVLLLRWVPRLARTVLLHPMYPLWFLQDQASWGDWADLHAGPTPERPQ